MQPSLIQFEERFYWSQRVSKVFGCSFCAFKDSKNDGSGIFFTLNDKREISWPEINSATHAIVMRTVPLSNIPIHFIPQSMFSIDHDGKICIYVCASADQDVTETFVVYVYVLINSSDGNQSQLQPIQEHFSLNYCPLDITRVSLDSQSYVLATGTDNALHVYALDPAGGLHRNSDREDLRAHWDSRLQCSSAGSAAIRLLIEEWPGGSQGVLGHTNGLLFSDTFPAMTTPSASKPGKKIVGSKTILHIDEHCSSTTKAPISPTPRRSPRLDLLTRIKLEDGLSIDPSSPLAAGAPLTPRSPTLSGGIAGVHQLEEELSSGFHSYTPTPPPAPKSNQVALLLEGAVTAMAPYKTSRQPYMPNYCLSNTITTNGEPQQFHCSDAVVVGTAVGSAAVIVLNGSSDRDSETISLLPGSSLHGCVHAIACGDVTMNGFIDVFLGFEDGTILLAGRDTDSAVVAMTPCMNPSSLAASLASSSSSSSSTPTSSLTFSCLWSICMSSPVMGLSFGALLGPTTKWIPTLFRGSAKTATPKTGASCTGSIQLFAEQLVVQTEKSFHIFTSSLWARQQRDSSGSSSRASASPEVTPRSGGQLASLTTPRKYSDADTPKPLTVTEKLTLIESLLCKFMT